MGGASWSWNKYRINLFKSYKSSFQNNNLYPIPQKLAHGIEAYRLLFHSSLAASVRRCKSALITQNN